MLIALVRPVAESSRGNRSVFLRCLPFSARYFAFGNSPGHWNSPRYQRSLTCEVSQKRTGTTYSTYRLNDLANRGLAKTQSDREVGSQFITNLTTIPIESVDNAGSGIRRIADNKYRSDDDFQIQVKRTASVNLFSLGTIVPKAKTHMQKPRKHRRLRSTDSLELVRQSAVNGAASALGHGRRDALEEIAASAVEKYIVQYQTGARPISNPKAWAFRVARNDATAWIRREQKQISLDASHPNLEGSGDYRADWQELASAEDGMVTSVPGKDEILEALPELFDWFQARVIEQLDADDRLFYERHCIDHWSDEQIAAAIGISPKSVAQRWRRIVLRLRKILLEELPAWHKGEELFSDAFRDARGLADLLCLARVYLKEGIATIRGIVESFTQK